MADTLAELELKFKSEIAAATNKDVQALQRVDAAIRASGATADQLAQRYAAAAAVRSAAEERVGAMKARVAEASKAEAAMMAGAQQRVATAQRAVEGVARGEGGKVDVSKYQAAVKALQKAQADAARFTAGGPAQSKGLQDALKQLVAAREKLKAASGKETDAAERLGAGKKSLAALQEARPRLVQLAQASMAAKDRAAQAGKALQAMGKGSRIATASAKEQVAQHAKMLQGLGQGAQAAGGPLGALAGRLGSLGQLGRAGWVGLLVAALAAFTIGVVAAYAALARFGFSAASVARDAKILGEALTGSAALGSEFVGVVDQLAGKVPLAKTQIAELAREMSLMRLGRRDLQAALGSVAVVTSALGDSAGAAVKSIVSSSAALRRFTLGARDIYGEYTALAGTGLKKADVLAALAKQLGKSMPEVEKQLLTGRVTLAQGMKALEAAAETRFGRTISAQMLSFDVQVRKARESLGGMFSRINIDPALRGLQQMLSVLDQGTVTGQGLKTVVTAGLQGLANVLGVVLPIGKQFFQGLIIGALRTYIMLRPVIRAVGELFGGFSKAGAGVTALEAGIAVAAALGTAIGVIGTVLGVVAGIAVNVGRFLMSPVESVKSLLTALGTAGLNAAKALGDGLVSGIKSIASRVGQAASDLAGSVAGTVAGVLKIGSPSRLMRQYGAWTGEGFALGLESQAPTVERAGGEMAGGATGPVMAASAGAGGAASASPLRALGGVTHVLNWTGDVIIGGQKAGADLREQVRQAMVEAFAETAGQSGAGRPAGAM